MYIENDQLTYNQSGRLISENRTNEYYGEEDSTERSFFSMMNRVWLASFIQPAEHLTHTTMTKTSEATSLAFMILQVLEL